MRRKIQMALAVEQKQSALSDYKIEPLRLLLVVVEKAERLELKDKYFWRKSRAR
jgi:hypothetical protein